MKEIATATTRAMGRVLKVLQQTLPLTCDAIADDGLYLPPPNTDAYFWLANVNQIDEILPNYNVSAFVYPLGSRTVIERRTGGPATYSALTEIPLEIMIAFQMAPQNNISAPGWNKELTSDEMMLLRCQRYSGAVMDSILTYIINDNDVTDVDPLNETFEIAALELQTIGMCRVSFNILQDVQIPRPLYTI